MNSKNEIKIKANKHLFDQFTLISYNVQSIAGGIIQNDITISKRELKAFKSNMDFIIFKIEK